MTKVKLLINHRVVNDEPALPPEKYLLIAGCKCLRTFLDRIINVPAQHATIAKHPVQLLCNLLKVPFESAIGPEIVIRWTGNNKMHRTIRHLGKFITCITNQYFKVWN